jgi:adenine deaminase
MRKTAFCLISTEKIRSLIKVALGKENANVVVKGGNPVNVYTRQGTVWSAVGG